MDGSRMPALDKFLEFLNKNTTLLLFLLLGGTFLLRLKYMTVNAGVWWDEAEYLRLAKHFAFGLQDIEAPYRERGMPLVYSLVYRLGLGELAIRFVEQVLSVVAVYFTYRLGKDMYSKRVGLVAALMLSVLWVHMFWATRISGGLFTMTLWVIAAYLFWVGYVKKGKLWYSFAAGTIVGFGTYAYASMGFILFVLLAYVLVTERLGFLKNKRFWYAAAGALLIVIPFALYSYDSFGSIYPRYTHTQDADWNRFAAGTITEMKSSSNAGLFFAYAIALPGFLKWSFALFFLAGLGFILFNLALGIDLLIKKKSSRLKRDLYVFLWAFFVVALFGGVYMTTGFEFDPRFLFPMYPAAFLIASVGLFRLYDLLKRYNRPVAFLAVSAVLVLGVYSNVIYADQSINAKKDTYMGEREAGLWIKDNTVRGDYVLTCNQASVFGYYTERNIEGFGANVTRADEQIGLYHPDFVVLDIYHPDCAFNLQQESSYALEPAYVSFVDEGKSSPSVIVYRVLYGQDA